MIGRKFVVLLAMVLMQLILGDGASAQSPTNCEAISIWYFGDPIPFGWFIYCPNGNPCGQGNYSFYIAAMKASCPPGDAALETCPHCPSGGKPISLATGNTFIEESDVSLPGLGGGLTLKRTWNSAWPTLEILSQVGIFGLSWKSNFEEKIFIGADQYVKYMRGDGSYWSFGINGTIWNVAAPANASATLVPNSSCITITFQNGEQRRFNPVSGLLTAIVDRNGNATQLTHDGAGRLATVTDAAGRHLYFQYGGSNSYLVSGVSSDFGLSLTYSYNAQGLLSQVTKPDLTTLNYTYDNNSRITSVTDSQGKVLESHTYDTTGRGLSSSRANGVESLSITYP
jgi:YD repeat-containing protein